MAASGVLFLSACSSMNWGTASVPVTPGAVTPEQAEQIIAAAGYGKIGPIGRSPDSGDWETTAVIDDVPYIVDVDHNGLLTAR